MSGPPVGPLTGDLPLAGDLRPTGPMAEPAGAWPEPLAAERAWGAPGGALLDAFNAAGVLGAAEVHVAARLAQLAGDPDDLVALAAALAVRAPRMGHVAADLRTARAAVAADIGDAVLEALPWPDPAGWVARVAASPLVAVGDEPAERPLRLIGSSVSLDRYWRDELAVAADLRARATAPCPPADAAALDAALARLFGAGGDPDQRAAAAVAAGRLFTVVAGGPGTGKTTTVARLLAVLHEMAAASGERPPLVALAAPTGKAAARLQEAVRAEAATMPTAQAVAARIGELSGATLHRLLGTRRSGDRPRHHRGHRLAADVIVVDEASMVSLGLMARLVDAARPDARLVLVGDPQQLVSVEAGAVLADIVAAADGPVLAGAVTTLRTNHRAAGALGDLAAAVRSGDADATLAVLGSGDPAITWVDTDPATAPDPAAAALGPDVVAWALDLVDAARAGDGARALAVLARHRVLCAHRRGPLGVWALNGAVEAAVLAGRPAAAGEGAWYAGRPVLVTANDYGLRLFNGDTAVAVAAARRHGAASAAVEVAVAAPGGAARSPRLVGPGRLAAVETVFAMTVHKSQGSEYERVTFVAPEAGSRLATRELLYTAVTRARHHLTVVGTAAALTAAVGRPIARASGLTARLTAPGAAPGGRAADGSGGDHR
ncbi:MAG TPA: exodeoxyribonuclease V subunit alpha [Acidimicrobiales bacterium]|nr:exodeoxyribonuclease V subunit alpha [Acidimicrobiales bacterium]